MSREKDVPADSPGSSARGAACGQGVPQDTGRDADGPLDPRAAARAARLHYVSDSTAGITRKAVAEGWVFHRPDGREVTDEDEIARIRALAIPPAYRDVWICTDPRGHLQAVGRDARGRKQYRYHPRWREIRDEAKFGKMLVFGEKLPVIRARVERDLALHGLPRQKVLAVVVRLLERTLARIGNEEYARTNKSFGLTTLRNSHVHFPREAEIQFVFDFKAKHAASRTPCRPAGQVALARIIVRQCQEVPGQRALSSTSPRIGSHCVFVMASTATT